MRITYRELRTFCFGVVLLLFAKNAFFRSTPKRNQKESKPKHGMDAVWVWHGGGMAAVCFFWKFLIISNDEVLIISPLA